jgi:hypothetical protein
MAAPIVTASLIGAGASVIGSIFGMSSAKKARRAAARREAALQGQLKALERNRQAIINPYAGVTDLSSMVEDVSSMASNPYDNLGVATQAAEIQMEQSDIALANTLDTLRATGASAGGATALARAALQSKKGISANIEQQESANEKLRAQGEANLQQVKMSEARRVQGALMAEQGRLQQADVSGKQFVFGQREQRETEQLNRIQAQITGQQQTQAQARSDSARALSAGIGSVGNIASSAVSAYGKRPAPSPPPLEETIQYKSPSPNPTYQSKMDEYYQNP